MGSSKDVYLEILNWEKYNGRRDVDRPSWFRCQNSIFFDDKFSDFSLEELGIFVFTMSYASLNQTGIFRYNVEHLARLAKTTPEKFRDAITKLEREGVVKIHHGKPSMPKAESAEEPRNGDVTPTERESTSTEITETTEKKDPPAAVFDFKNLLKKYPRRKLVKREWEEEALETLRKTIKTSDEVKALTRAIENFAKFHVEVKKKEEKYIPTFKTFFGHWRYWIFYGSDFGPLRDTGKPCKASIPEGCAEPFCIAHTANDHCATRLSNIGVSAAGTS